MEVFHLVYVMCQGDHIIINSIDFIDYVLIDIYIENTKLMKYLSDRR